MSCLPARQQNLHRDRKIERVSRRSPPDRIDASPGFDRMIEGGLKTVGHETQCVEKVALSRAISTHENREMAERYIRLADTLVIADSDSLQKGSAFGGARARRVHAGSISVVRETPTGDSRQRERGNHGRGLSGLVHLLPQ